MKVLAIKPYATEKSPDAGYVKVEDETGKQVDAWTPKISALEVGKDAPEGWELKGSDKGPRLLPPYDRKGGGQSAYRNTKDGQAYEQERMDRRTALMQAVTYVQATPAEGSWLLINDVADQMYEWLRKTSGNPQLHPPATAGKTGANEALGQPQPGTSAPPLRGDGADQPEGKAKGQLAYGEGAAVPTPTPPAPNELWDKARELGLSPPKAVVMAHKRGWDHVRSSTDLTDAQLAELIAARKEELA